METAPLDPSLPGVRMLQNWIREGLAVSIAILDQERIEGRLIWQDPEFLALERLGSTRPVLIALRHITTDSIHRLINRRMARSQPCHMRVP